MRVSREKMAANRARILDAASRLFRARGFEAVSVAEIMQAAGLTHGGFYGHFASKEELAAAALGSALAAAPAPAGDLSGYIAAYLSPGHREDCAGGCPTAALATDTTHRPDTGRAVMTAGLRRQIERLAELTPGADAAARRRAAIGTWSAMVGALVLARVSDDIALADEILDETRAWLGAA